MNGKIISVSSVKGGVGKTTILLNLAGIYCELGKRVLIIDMDLFSGGIAISLDIKNTKDIFMLVDSMANNRFTELSKYVTSYNSNIDVLLVDTSHVLNDINLTILDYSYMSLFIVTNDLVDLKNMKSLLSVFIDTDKKNYLICLNSSRDTGRDYMSMYDIRATIDSNIDYTISSNYYIKNIDKYVMSGEILTLNKKINTFHPKDVANMKKMALDLIDDRHIKEGK